MSTYSPRRKATIGWVIAFAVLVAAFIATIAILNSVVYSAPGFVSSYFSALNRHDATTARQLPGVAASANTATNLLTDDALGTVSRIHLVSDKTTAGDIHALTYGYSLGGTKGVSTFHVKQTGTFLGLFPRWSFSISPLATVSVTVLHDRTFRANGTSVTTLKKNVPASYVVFAPGLYAFDHRSEYLAAAPVHAAVEEPGSVTPVQVDVQANAAFVKDVTTELDHYFDTCATQKVLLPTSCPFGKSFSNRVVSKPKWSMVTDPKITIVPHGSTGNWLVPESKGKAHLVVKVQSLFDGTVSTYDKNVPFDISYSIVIGADNHLTITELR